MWHILICLLLIKESPTFDVQTLDGRVVSGSLAELTADRLTVETDSGKMFFETEKLQELSLKHKPAATVQPAGAWIELTDGSTVVARQYTVHGEMATITLLNDEVLETPARSIRNVRLQHLSESMAGQWSQIISAKLDGDVLVVNKGDNLDYHQGVLGDINAEVVRFQLDGDNLPINRAKVCGLAYRHTSGEASSGPICRLNDIFGSHWQVSKIGLEKKLQLTTPSGATFSCAPENVASIDYSLGKIVYLSDLKPESVTWSPYFRTEKTLPSIEQFYAPRQDRNFESNPLQLAGTEYSKGLAIRSRTEVVYRLPGSFTRLNALTGIDDSVRPQGNVRLVIRGDNNVLLDVTVAGTDAPKPIDLDLSGVRRLTVLVDFGNRAGFGDHLDLCNARIIK
jgi:NPCBM/NEW2 domain